MFDNAVLISRDPRIRHATAQNIGLIFTGEYWYKSGNLGLYRPLTTFSYLVNYAVFGDGVSPAGYHWVNLALHVVNVALVYALGIAILGDPLMALALAAIWGLHPLLTESVTNIVGRADLLAGFGVLAGLLCYLKGAAAVGRRKLAWLAALASAQAVGLFSKESAAMLPAIMLLYDLAWSGRAGWRKRAPAYAVLALPFAAFLSLRAGLHTRVLVDFGDNPLAGAGFWTARITAVKVIGNLLWLFVWPARLSADYSYDAVPLFGWRLDGEDAKAAIALAVWLCAAALAVRWRRTWKSMFFFLAFFFVALLPVSNLIIPIGTIMAERFVYLPSVGLAGCVVVAIGMISVRRTPAAWIAAVVVCLALVARTHARNLDWHDDLSLWSSAAEVAPGSAKVHNNLGYALLQIPGRLSEALAEYQTALRIRPDYPEAHYNLGNALARVPGRRLEAITEYEAALRIKPGYAEAHNNLGNALLQVQDRLPEAIAEYRAALAIERGYAEAHNNLGNALLQVPGRLPEAIAEYKAALEIQPDYAEAHNNLGNALLHAPGGLPAAIAQYQAALEERPDYAEAHNNLANAFAQMPGRLADAIPEYQAALRIRPGYSEAHNNLGNALAQMPGRLPEAIAEYQAAVRGDPGLADAHYNLGNALLQMGKFPEARAEFEEVQRIKPDPQVQQILDRLREHRP